MASMTMAAVSLLPTSMAKNPAATRANRGGLIVAAKASSSKAENVSVEFKNNKDESSSNGRRELVFAAAAAAAAACSIAKVAMAETEEPKRGTPDAKKKYAPVCVTMPTARICRK